MRNIIAIFRREFASYFATPLACVFIVIFLVLSAGFTFIEGGFLAQGQADLRSFFVFHPWLYLVLVPALTMRLWAEERKTGTIELLLTLPIFIAEAVLGKFLAAWAFTALVLALTFPMWLTVNYLGAPDNGVIVASYTGSLLMAGGFLAVGSCLSATTGNQVIAFVITAAACFVLVMSGSPLVLGLFQGWAPDWLVADIASFSFLTHFSAILRGVVDLRDAVFFLTTIALFLLANGILVDLKKAG